MLEIPFLDCLTTVLTTRYMRVVTTELLFCYNTHFNKSSKYAFILKVHIEFFNQGCFNIVNRFNKNAYLQYIFKQIIV